MKGGKALARPSFYEFMIHQQDVIKNHGFDYETKLLEKVLSSYMLTDPAKEYSFKKMFEGPLVALIKAVGNIKKQFNYTVPKNYKLPN